jgi:N utilization substance protein A
MINFLSAIKQLALEKGLPEEIVIQTVESALAAAYRKDYGKPGQMIQASIDPKTGALKIWQVYKVVKTEEEIENPSVDVLPDAARKFNKKAKVGDEIKIELPYKEEFGRIAAQTAKQVIIQRLREAERGILFDEFKAKEHQIVAGIVRQIEARAVVVNLGKTTGVLLPSGQIPGENYTPGKRMRVYLQEVEETIRGPRIIISRSNPEFISALFAMEVPEIENETVKIMGLAREAGTRTKIAVWSDEDGIDPVGSAVGQHGSRVQAVLSEIGEEKIDIILYDKEPKNYIVNALSPAKISKITLKKKDKKAVVEVPEDQLSLAIGRRGQNVRLASILTGWEIDIQASKPKESKDADAQKQKDVKTEELEEIKHETPVMKHENEDNKAKDSKTVKTEKSKSKTKVIKKDVKETK